MTTIQDTLTYADGSLANGRLVIWWKPFTIGNADVVGGELETAITAGTVSISLYPNAGAQPQGIYYNAKYELENGAVYTEQWIVPDLPTASIGQVRVSFPPTPSVMISPTQLTSLDAQAGMFLQWDGTRWVPAYTSAANISPNWIGITAGTSGSDVNITGSPVSLGHSLTINIPDAGPTSRGVVTTGAQTFAGNKTFSGNVTVTGTLTIPPGFYVPVMGASGSAHAPGIVPDPGATAGVTRFLREDAVWAVPAGGSGGSSYWVGGSGGAIYYNGGPVGIGISSPLAPLQVREAANQNVVLQVVGGFTSIQAVNDAVSVWVPLQYYASAHYLMGGNVGIGTTSPSSLLQVGPGTPLAAGVADFYGPNKAVAAGQSNLNVLTTDAAAVDKGGTIGLGGVGGGNPYAFAIIAGRNEAGSSYAGYFQISTVAAGGSVAERMRITSAGAIGIGLTNPTQKLQVAGNIYANGGEMIIDSGHGLHVGSLDVGNYAARGRDDNIGFYGGNLLLQDGGTGFTGNVGIGGTNPSSKLWIDGQGATPSLSANHQIFTVRPLNANGQTFQIGAIASAPWATWIQGSYDANVGIASPLSLQPAGGSVGIGTVSPAYPFHVSGRSFIQNPVNEAYVLGLQSSQSANVTWLGTDSASSFVVLNAGGSVLCTITSAGSLTVPGVITANTYFYTTAKSSHFGTAANTAAGGASAPTTADANILLYDFSSGGTGNWAGMGIDGGGNMWFRTGLSGSPNPALFISSGGSGAIGVGTLAPGYKLDIAGDCNLSAGSVYRVNGVPIATGGGGISTQTSYTSPTRQLNAKFTNSSGKPMWVSVTVSINAANTGASAYSDSNSGTPTTEVARVMSNPSGPVNFAAVLGFWVLPGNGYEVNGVNANPGVVMWWEYT